MYSLLPAAVASIFLGYGVFVACTQGFTRIGTSFFALCITSAVWQGTWAVLFQVRDPFMAMFLVKLGYLLIIFLPSSMYHFLAEVSMRTSERRYVYLSYGVAGCLALTLLFGDDFVSGYYVYFFGFYPKAGPLHPLHVLQTMILGARTLYITYMQRRHVGENQRGRLTMCVAAVLIYCFAAVDYLCNYGVEFYPPGVVFIAVSLGIFVIVRYDLVNPLAIANAMAQEMRMPLLTIRNQARGIARDLPVLLRGYEAALKAGLIEPGLKPGATQYLATIGSAIGHEADRANTGLDLMLASLRMDLIDARTFSFHSVKECVDEAMRRYPFTREERSKISVEDLADFRFYGSETLLDLVLFNLFKNALQAIRAAGKGEIRISSRVTPTGNMLLITDTGTGIEKHIIPRLFDPFFTAKQGGKNRRNGGSGGSGIGLALCRRVVASFGGRLRCESIPGEFTTFTLDFPALTHGGTPIPSLDPIISLESSRTEPNA